MNWLPNPSPTSLRLATERIAAHDTAAQIVVASLHWGDNWGYGVSAQEREFAHGLIDEAGVDVVHGHSSHHPKGIEVYRRRVILYGCGDLLNDYEGIGGYESYRAELGLMYFLTLDATSGELRRLSMTPTRMQRLRVSRAAAADAAWLQASLDRECRALGSAGVVGETDSSLTLRPAQT